MGKTHIVITVKEEVQLPDSDIILEKGDKIQLLEVSNMDIVTTYSHFVSAIINDDYSGLSDRDEKELEDFYRYVFATWGSNAYISGIQDDDEAYFGTPSNGGLAGDVANYTVIY